MLKQMEHPTGFRKQISVILVFVMLSELTGCHSYVNLTSGEIKPGTFYLVHAGKQITYRTCDLAVTDSAIYGKLYFDKLSKGQDINAHIYLSPDSEFVVNNEEVIFPRSSVARVTELVYDKAKTKKLKTLLIVGSIVGVTVIVVGVTALNSIIDDLEAVETTSSTGLCSNW